MFNEHWLLALGLGSLFKSQSCDGFPISTVALLVVVAFWTGCVCGSAPVLFCVSPSLRRILQQALLRTLGTDEDHARARLMRYRRD